MQRAAEGALAWQGNIQKVWKRFGGIHLQYQIIIGFLDIQHEKVVVCALFCVQCSLVCWFL